MYSYSNHDSSVGKMFVGGLSWESTQDTLQRYFGQYGDIIDCIVMKNTETGRSRGFGFVTFSDPTNVDAVLKSGPHELDGRTIDPKACNPRSMQKQKRNNSWPKIFLGGLPSNLTETDLRTYFSRFGTVMEVVIMFDQEKKKSRGFGFLSFESDEAVDRAVSEHYVNINGKQKVEIKKAEPRDVNKSQDGSDGQWGSPPDSQWTMHGMGPPGMPGMNNGMGPSNMGPPMPPMGPHNSQMSGPMGTQSIVQGPYQGWGTPPQQQGYPPQGYGAPQGPQGYQGWGTGQQVPQWGAQYGSHGGQQFGSFGDPYHRSAQMNTIVAGTPGAPSPNLTTAAKGTDDYSSWTTYGYNQITGGTGENAAAAAAAAAAFNHSRGYGSGAGAGGASQGQAAAGGARSHQAEGNSVW